jgi:ubiquinol-cytochrome c reductase iron-sulfur subunit
MSTTTRIAPSTPSPASVPPNAPPNAPPSAGPGASALPNDPQRRIWIISTGVVGGAGLLATAVPFVETLAPSERAKAAGGPVEVDVSTIPPGTTRTVEWRGKPVWVVHRTPEMLQALNGHDDELVDSRSLRDEQPDTARNATRSIRPELFVVIGICTHLGCSPNAAPRGTGNPSLPTDWPGGFLCPCHGSTFDGAGRVFKNKPAPTNLEVPPHRYSGANLLTIGEAVA